MIADAKLLVDALHASVQEQRRAAPLRRLLEWSDHSKRAGLRQASADHLGDPVGERPIARSAEIAERQNSERLRLDALRERGVAAIEQHHRAGDEHDNDSDGHHDR